MKLIKHPLVFLAAMLLSLGAEAQAQDIPVSSIQHATGVGAFSGVAYQNAIRLAVDEFNAKGGVQGQKIKLMERDDASDKGQTINLANQAVDRDRAVLVLGPSSTANAVASAPIFNDRKTPNLSFATSDAVLNAGPWSLKMQQSPSVINPLIAKYVLEKTRIKRVAIVFDRTNEALIESKTFFRDPFKAGGGVITSEEAVVSSDSNFLPLATKLKAQQVDAVYLGTYTDQAANIIQQLRQAGVPESVRFIGTITLASPKFISLAGKAAEGTITVGDYMPGINRPLNKSFEAAYKARYGVEPDSWAATGYTLAQVALATLREAGPNPTREKVRDAYFKLRDVPILGGSGLWNQTNRKPYYGAIVQIVKDGKLVAAP